MNLTQKNELKKIAKLKIDRSKYNYLNAVHVARDEAYENACKKLGLEKIQAKIDSLMEKVEDLKEEERRLGVGYHYSKKCEFSDVLKDSPLHKACIEELEKSFNVVDFDKLFEDIVVEIYMSDDAEAVKEILSRIPSFE